MLQESAESAAQRTKRKMLFSSAMSLLMTLVTVVGIMSEGRGKNLKGPYLFSQGAQKGLIVGKGGQSQGFNLLLASRCVCSPQA